MQKLTLSNNKSLDAYRTVALNKAVANNLSQLDKLNKKDSADQLVYKQGEDTYIAVGRGDLRGVKVGDTVNVGADKLEVLYVSNKPNTKAEVGNKELFLSAALPGSLVGACAAGLGAVIVGGPAAIAIGAVGGLVLGTLGIFAQMKHSMKGEPQSVWNKLK
jgi:hypothetical protein